MSSAEAGGVEALELVRLGGGDVTDLGGQIEAEHQAAHREARSALDHALRCGELLLEAKRTAGHGGWLDWLRAHTTVTPRQAQRYMRLAEARDSLKGKCDTGTHLTLRGALAALAEPRSPAPEEDIWGWATSQLEGPFNGWDLEHVDCGWLTTKLLHHLHVDPVVALFVDLTSEYRIPALRLAPADQLAEALRRVVPYAKTAADVPAIAVDTAGMSARTQFGAGFILKITAQSKLVKRIDQELERVRADAAELAETPGGGA